MNAVAVASPAGPVLEQAQPLTPVPAAFAGEPGAELDALVDGVLELTTSPIDERAVAATLESRGLRDVDARERYGRPDTFVLAADVYARARARLEREPPEGLDEEEALTRAARARRALGWYLKGAAFIVSLALQAGSLVLFDFSLWAYLSFSYEQATAVAMAILAAFLVTSGFEQAIGRLGPVYVERGQHALARRACLSGVWSGLLFSAVVGAAAWGVNRLGGFFPEPMFRVTLVYYILLCALALLSAVLYMLNRWSGLALTTLVGLCVVGLVLKRTDLGIYAAHWMGLGAASVGAYAWAFTVLRREARSLPPAARAMRLPRISMTLSSLLPHVAYGVLYSLLIFSDRTLAWSALENPEGLPLWFDTPYEIGLDLALILAIPALALLHYSGKRITKVIIPAQKRFAALEIAEHNADLMRFYWRQVALVAAFIAGMCALLWGFVEASAALGALESARGYVAGTVAWDVFVWGLVGYALLSWALLNAVFLFSLALPGRVLTAMVPSVILCVALGYGLSRGVEYWMSVLGMTAGCALFALLTTVSTVRVLRHSDYHYYAAY